ncbi:hydantoinase/oxoprolinase N-terminal domain-containing protein [Streptomyces sp. NPDC088719]|uniref:hydantoinase/oxoprolinase N-terminal domain-containing protein n=1 Tax=Streptomyces sp. NPDC088719 TaxID=3365872 RepID=UPI0037F87BCF
MRLGIDVGRATTVAVATRADGTVAARARVDSAPAFAASVRSVLAALGPLPGPAASVAVLTDLRHRPTDTRPVAVLRIAPPSHPALAPATGPARLTGRVAGGASVTGTPLAPLDREAVLAFARRAADAGVTAFAICAAGAPARPGSEHAAAAIVAEVLPRAALSLSHEIGSTGLRERENATLANAALGAWADRLVADAGRALTAHGVTAPLYFARDDGGVVSAEYFRRHPVIATAPAACTAARGAALRTGARRALVVDAAAHAVRCVTVVDGEPERAEPGPGPFGLRMDLGGPRTTVLPYASGAFDPQEARHLVERERERLPDAEVVWTGGAAPAGPDSADDAARFAARADCGVEIEQIVVATGRAELEALLEAARGHALSRAVAAGATPGSVRVDRSTHTPVSYLPAGVHRVRIRATGLPSGRAEP